LGAWVLGLCIETPFRSPDPSPSRHFGTDVTASDDLENPLERSGVRRLPVGRNCAKPAAKCSPGKWARSYCEFVDRGGIDRCGERREQCRVVGE
jgi:hypothetical protein